MVELVGRAVVGLHGLTKLVTALAVEGHRVAGGEVESGESPIARPILALAQHQLAQPSASVFLVDQYCGRD